ncbi:MAG: hypothetical protein ACJ77O_00605 [Chloroflexota bacterium]
MERGEVREDDPHELARELRLQEFGKTRPTSIDDPLIEPAWLGPRVVAAVGDHPATLWWDGEAFDERPEVAAALARATDAAVEEGAIFEGYLSKQLAPEGVGADIGVSTVTPTSAITKMFVGGRRDRAAEYEERRAAEREALTFAPEDVVSLVVVDLLWLDGQWLLEVPLLERKRVLESIVPAEQLIRPSPYVREPLGSWMGSWRAQGFRAMSFKAANSRYRPGETARDWTLADLPRR